MEREKEIEGRFRERRERKGGVNLAAQFLRLSHYPAFVDVFCT